MSNRRRIGVSAATTEAARRQLMQPVTCWEKVWITPAPEATAGTAVNLKVYKWVKTEKVPHFSDDEDEADEPLAPLPDEVEVIDGDEDMEAEETAMPTTKDAPAAAEAPAPDPETNEEDPSKAATPSTEPQLHLDAADNETTDDIDIGALDDTLKAMEGETAADMELGNGAMDEGALDMSMAALGPDGLPLESSHDLTQVEGPTDAIMGGPMMDNSEDPFATPENSVPPPAAQGTSYVHGSSRRSEGVRSRKLVKSTTSSWLDDFEHITHNDLPIPLDDPADLPAVNTTRYPTRSLSRQFAVAAKAVLSSVLSVKSRATTVVQQDPPSSPAPTPYQLVDPSDLTPSPPQSELFLDTGLASSSSTLSHSPPSWRSKNVSPRSLLSAHSHLTQSTAEYHQRSALDSPGALSIPSPRAASSSTKSKSSCREPDYFRESSKPHSRSHTPLNDPPTMAALNEKVNESVDFGGDYDYGDRQWFTDMPEMPQRPPPQPVEDPYVPQQDVVEQNEIFQFALSAAPNVLYARYKQYGQLGVLAWCSEFGEMIDGIKELGFKGNMFVQTRSQALETCEQLLKLKLEDVKMQIIVMYLSSQVSRLRRFLDGERQWDDYPEPSFPIDPRAYGS